MVKVSRESDVILNLLVIYYVFDVGYPGPYGCLSVMDSLILQKLPVVSGEPQPQQKKTKKTAPKKLSKFLKEFDAFLNKVSAAASACADDVDEGSD